MARYNYYVNGNTVICVSRYAGKNVRATAKCNPEDEFNLSFGKHLARARVDEKVAQKRLAALGEKRANLVKQVSELTRKIEKYDKALDDAFEEADGTKYFVDALLEEREQCIEFNKSH